MALYNRFFNNYDDDTNGGNEDFYHGEYDDEAYGNLYIPRIEEEDANFDSVKRVFLENKIGLVTSAVFTWLPKPEYFKGRVEKYLFSCKAYIKWNDGTKFREHVLSGNKKKSRVTVNKQAGTYWIVRPNTSFPSEELLIERYEIEDLLDTATDCALSALDNEEEDDITYELEQTARAVALQAIMD
jgi:hypothetical protein